jgi:hypothetical protein
MAKVAKKPPIGPKVPMQPVSGLLNLFTAIYFEVIEALTKV